MCKRPEEADLASVGPLARPAASLMADLEPRFAIAPLVLEALVQHAALLAMYCQSVHALPVGIAKVRLGPLPSEETPMFLRVRGASIGDGLSTFQGQILDPHGRLVMVAEGLEFKAVGKLPDALGISF